MDHKAFLFSYQPFRQELLPLIEDSLATGNLAPLQRFVDTNLAVLRSPYSGKPLKVTWRSLLETESVDEYGDFALTKYYDPRLDIGLCGAWQTLNAKVADLGWKFSPILGRPIGNSDRVFDPGKMGTYFQTESEVIEGLLMLQGLRNTLFDPMIRILEEAAQGKMGLFVTF